MRFYYLFIFIFMVNLSFAQTGTIGEFQFNSDIGNPKIAGSASYNESGQEYTLKGAGYNIWFGAMNLTSL